MTVNRSDNWLP